MESLLLQNLASNQAFVAAVKNGRLNQMAGRYISDILFTPDDDKRDAAIKRLEDDIVGYYKNEAQPNARRIGLENAKRVLSGITGGAPADLNDPELRRKILIGTAGDAKQRLRIVQSIVNDHANTLGNRLAAYWLEPGTKNAEKLARLVELHTRQEKARKDYDKALAQFHTGAIDKRPRAPKLDYMAAFQEGVKNGIVQQARRDGTDVETRTFVQQGYEVLAWVTVNASEACPDCKARQGETGNLEYWASRGKPGSGATVCGANCFCMLVPSKAITQNPGLRGGLNTPKPIPTPTPTPTPTPPAAPTPEPVRVAKAEPQARGEAIPTATVKASERIDVQSSSRKVVDVVKDATKSIEKVHSLPPNWPAVRVGSKVSSRNNLGEYYRGNSRIEIQPKQDTQRMTFVHEFGHYIDNRSPNPNAMSSVTADDPLFDEWRKAVRESEAIKTINEQPRTRRAQKTIQYLSSKHEMWARSYAQWIAQESGDETMLAEIAAMRRNSDILWANAQWERDDFEPIAKAMRKIFDARGLTHDTRTR